MDKIQKFLLKLNATNRTTLLYVLSDIKILNLEGYDIKQLKGFHSIFRLRKGKIRIIFRKDGNAGTLLDISYRKDSYRQH
ncbi:MAG: hypothetical protein UT33_C0010G0025 [Candidatus Peregrinibacteria bacterium GW2011_GWC2_39_14]|nr:MAG: hypothetical protein US92_C0006G0025 [Candidatus Peregrinibacteria bacterium GW2011_GWA2_38_36]KKR05882.1 MAG: hypothetical protein UT33_C0010G0025 [Candidatus Peregrinibacteria bacterium GW2011_GWC2_39_14]